MLEDGEVFLLLDVVQSHNEIGEVLAHVSLTLTAPVVDPGLDLVVDVVEVARVRRRKTSLAALAGLVPDAVIAKPRVGIEPDVLSRVGVETRDVVPLAVGGGFHLRHMLFLGPRASEYRQSEGPHCVAGTRIEHSAFNRYGSRTRGDGLEAGALLISPFRWRWGEECHA